MPEEIPLDELTPCPDRMPAIMSRFQADRDSLERRFTAPHSPQRRERLRAFYAGWQKALDAMPLEELSRSDRLDWIVLWNLFERELARLLREEQRFAEIEPLIPFAPDLIALDDERRDLQEVDPRQVAERLDKARRLACETREALESKLDAGEKNGGVAPGTANRAADVLEAMQEALQEWFGFHHRYHPDFTWWAQKPFRTLRRSLREYGGFLRKRLAGADDPDAIVGDPIGRDAVLEELTHELIAYTPEELIGIGSREMEWCREEMLRASQDMGCGNDWRAALEGVKDDHVPPGEQPKLVRDLAVEAIGYVDERDLVTVPALARECWRMEMMTPERQKVNPFFLGGETIVVSFPTNTMEHEQKRMSLRGNNRAFSRATVQHELIPGHYLQAFCQERHRPYRRLFYTPFWVEGWPLYWEMLLWDLGFPRTPEERIGMLFWRMHRCARVVFSLRFHLGEMSPQECVDMLVDEVGHERENALGEVRRSLKGSYGPLYQCAYLIGGLQFRALHDELVGSGPTTQREFHDTILRENCMPLAALRAFLLELPLERDFAGEWRFG